MCITRTCLGTISTFLSLVTALEGPEDANYFILNPPITTRQSSTATEFEINAHATIGTLNIVYPEVCSSGYQSQPCDIQAVFSLAEWHILGMAITAIFLVWYARKLLDCTETGVYRATYRAGRSEAVSKATECGLRVSYEFKHRAHSLTLAPPAPIGESSPQGDNTSLPRGRQPATAVSSEVTTRHRFPPCWAVDPPIPLVKELESQLNNSATTDSHGLISLGRKVVRNIVIALRISSRRPIFSPLYSSNPCSLRRSLHTGARDLGENLIELNQFVFLFAGVDINSNKDAENDTEFLRQMFASSAQAPRYECISGPSATLSGICEKVRILLGQVEGTPELRRVFMLFTGTGDADNAMCLPNGEVLSESDLLNWLSCYNQANEYTISVFFDICRTAMQRSGAPLQDVDLVWSCSEGQFAYAISLSDPKGGLFPRSIFLLAIFLAAHHTNIHGQDTDFFEKAFAFHITQLSEFILFMYSTKHQDRCHRCLKPAPGPCAAPEAQRPDVQQSGYAIVSLGMLIARDFPQHARKVFETVDHEMLGKKFPGRLCSIWFPDDMPGARLALAA